jgi:GNAT superfamily N-acetyltransferase
VAERDGQVAGLVVMQPPARAAWVAPAVAVAPASYLTCGFVTAGSRGGGVGGALVRRALEKVDGEGIPVTALHYAALNPLSGPFWHRCGYRPLSMVWARGTVG